MRYVAERQMVRQGRFPFQPAESPAIVERPSRAVRIAEFLFHKYLSCRRQIGDGYAQTRVDAVVIARSGQRQSRRTTQAGQVQGHTRDTGITEGRPKAAEGAHRRRFSPSGGNTAGDGHTDVAGPVRRAAPRARSRGALTLGVAGSLIYESQVLQDGTVLLPPCSSGRVRRR
jgi:hypothetical protein